MRVPGGLERHLEGAIPTDLKLISVKSVQVDGLYMRLDIEVEYPTGERFWLEDAPLIEAYNTHEGSLYILQEGNLRIAMVGAGI